MVNGPVELFYTLKQGMGAGGAPMMMGGGIRRVWYLRRQGGELQEVDEFDFQDFATRYFAGCPELTATFNAQKKDRLEYDDLVIAVRAYNRCPLHNASPAAGH